MTEIPISQRIGLIKSELQKPDLDGVRLADLTSLLGQYQGAADARLASHTARMLNPELALRTTADYYQSLDLWFLDMFPPEESA